MSYSTVTSTTVGNIDLRYLLVLQMTRKEFNREVEEKVKALFTRVNECLAAATMNPLYTLHSEITSTSFDMKVR